MKKTTDWKSWHYELNSQIFIEFIGPRFSVTIALSVERVQK